MKHFERADIKRQSYSRSVYLAGGGVPRYGTGVGPRAGYQQPYPGKLRETLRQL